MTSMFTVEEVRKAREAVRRNDSNKTASEMAISPEHMEWLNLSYTKEMLRRLELRVAEKLRHASRQSRDTTLDDKFIRLLINEACEQMETIKYICGEPSC